MKGKLKGFVELDGHIIKEGTIQHMSECKWPTESDTPLRTWITLESGQGFYIDKPLAWVLLQLGKE